MGGGERGATETNNLVCMKKQKHIYDNSTHETTMIIQNIENQKILWSGILLSLQ